METELKRKILDKEWQAAVDYTQSVYQPRFQDAQMKQIREWSIEAAKSQKEHWKLHNAIGMAVLVLLIGCDILVAWQLPPIFNNLGLNDGIGGLAVLTLLAGAIHGFIAYSIVNYSIHEGAGHHAIIFEKGPFSRFLGIIANHSCRLFFGDPIFYRLNHALHHQKFATREDGAFSNFVASRRIIESLMPFAAIFNRTDYKIHSGMAWTASRVITMILSGLYLAGLMFIAWKSGGLFFSLIAFGFLGPWIGFALDRLRETSEHSLMPLNYFNGSRNLGVGFWAMVIGGGPWGQPCHLSHHLGPQLAWYNQMRLHTVLLKILTPEQREFFMVEPGLLGYPKFVMGQWTRIRAIEREQTVSSQAHSVQAL